MPDPIVNSYELGDSIEEIHEGFPSLLSGSSGWWILFTAGSGGAAHEDRESH
jgi:hypothetical protein